MKLEAFKAGDYKQQYQYRSFSPAFINHAWNWDDGRVSTLLEQATKALGELNAFSLIVPDVDLFIILVPKLQLGNFNLKLQLPELVR